MKKLIPLILMAIAFSTCKKDSANQPDNSPPVTSSISPGTGQPETLITISGTGFSTVPGDNVVKFNGVTATIVSATASTLIVKVPVSAGSGPVTVTTSHGTSSGIAFTYLPDVYIAGTESNGSKLVAKYWKNGVPYSISDGTKDVTIYSMALSGPDMYLAGSEVTANGLTVAKYWKNGVATELSDTKNSASIYSIVINGKDVYAVGSEWDGTSTFAKYWKNGVPVTLTDGKNYASAYSICISGNDIYVAGEEGIPNGLTAAKYWKNGQPTHLTNYTNLFSSAAQIAVVNNDIHIVIYNFDGTTNSYNYWKNGSSVPVSGATQIDQLLISGNDVYMVGRQSRIATYWKNGTPVALTDGSNLAFAHSIALYGNDVYVTGNEVNNSVKQGKYWKNSVPVNLTDGKYNTSLWSIIVR